MTLPKEGFISMTYELPIDRCWIRTKDVVDELNLSKPTLYRRKSEGYFKQGTHFVTTGPGSRSNVLWNVEACRKVFAKWELPQM